MVRSQAKRTMQDAAGLGVPRPTLRRAFAAEAEKEMEAALADHSHPFVEEIYTDTAPNARGAAKRGHKVGESKTLRTGWNFYLESHRKACLEQVKKDKPFLLALAFPCSVWPSPMRLVPAVHVQRLRLRDRVLVEFAAELAKLKVEAGRHLLIENPDQSAAWSLVAALASITVDDRSLLCRCHQCRFCKTDAHGVTQKKAT